MRDDRSLLSRFGEKTESKECSKAQKNFYFKEEIMLKSPKQPKIKKNINGSPRTQKRTHKVKEKYIIFQHHKAYMIRLIRQK